MIVRLISFRLPINNPLSYLRSKEKESAVSRQAWNILYTSRPLEIKEGFKHS